MKTLNEVLSKFYRQPVLAGFTNAGWPVVRPANDPTGVIDGGMGNDLPPAVETLIRMQAEMDSALVEFDVETDEAMERQ